MITTAALGCKSCNRVVIIPKSCYNRISRMKRTPKSNLGRFKPKMGEQDENGCVPFLGHIASVTGYGSFAWRKKPRDPRSSNIGAHVASYRLFVGPIPKGKLVMHDCNNRSCVNPKHLLIGTQADNMAHCIKSGRTAKGENQRGGRDYWLC